MEQRFRHIGRRTGGWLLAGALVGFVLLPGPASAAGRRNTPAPAPAEADASWAIGKEAVLPANAATTDQKVSINWVSCSSVGNCSAVGTYLDSSGTTQGLLLSEKAGTWATGVEALLPANAATTNGSVELNSVSCSSAGNCGAVGTYLDNSINDNGEGLLLTETAGTWSQGVEATLPANASTDNQSVYLPSVSCPSAGNCTAVGIYLNNSNNSQQGLLLSETAGVWSAGVAPALPANALSPQGGLHAVSCVSAGNCTAVGGYADSSGAGQGLLLTETSGSWSTGVEAALPANAASDPNVSITSISCTSVGNCSAVGVYTIDSVPPTTQGLLLTETAGTWSTGVEAVMPANATTVAPGPLYSMGSVSCASAGNCSAVGVYTDNSGNLSGLLLTETDGTWATGSEASLPADAATSQQDVSLTSVSCPSAGNCSAVGSYEVSGGGVGLLLTETSGSWTTGTEVSLPANGAPGPNFSSINSVSCASSANCSAVGWYAPSSSGGGNQGLLLGTTATPPQATLTVSDTGGDGSGAITSSPSGIDCGSTCASSFTIGDQVTLTATPSANSFFVSWSGSGSSACQSISPCQVAITGDTAVTADFALRTPYVLAVQRSGSGSGSVTSNPAGIKCGSTCAFSFAAETQVTLTATPNKHSTFGGWSGGGCSGTGTCELTIAAATTVKATFKASATKDCLVPKLKGETLDAAKRLLKSHLCSLGTVKNSFSGKVKRGHVISQNPKPGTRLKKEAKVNLVVSKGT